MSAEAPRAQLLELPDGAEGAALVLHEESCAERPSGGCDRWPEKLRLRSTLGELVRGRCGAANLCAYCARLAAIENSELLALDALHGPAPAVWCVLTTRSTSTRPADFYDAGRQLRRALRAAFPGFAAASVVEFTTGYGTRSEGQCRPHWNWLLKGVDVADQDQVRALIAAHWCRIVDAEIEAQWVGPIEAHGGLMRYLALHFHKSEQAPPIGWRGHRFRATPGYLWLPTPAAREAARAALRLKRELHRAHELGLFGEDAEAVAQARVYEASELAWELVRLQPLPVAFGADGLPSEWTTEVTTV